MADYPAGVYAPRTKANRAGVVYDAAKTTVSYAEDVQKLDAEVVAIETELGTNPKGAKADVKTRLDDVDTALGNIPVKATGAEIDTGTDDAKFATAKAIRDSGVLSGAVAGEIMGLTDKDTPLDADVVLAESAADTNAKRKITWANIKSVLKTYFDGLYLALAGGTLSGDITFGENTYLVFDDVLSADGKACGIIQNGTAGAALAFGDLCYLDPTDSRWELADAGVITAADGDCRGTLGICVLAANANGDATKMLFWGKVRAATFPVFTVNAQLFISETAGDITETIPTSLDHAIRCVGVALTSEDLFFNPSMDNITRIV